VFITMQVTGIPEVTSDITTTQRRRHPEYQTRFAAAFPDVVEFFRDEPSKN
jgi:hypothetical protein